MLASETVTSHQDGPLNQIPDKAASKPGAGLASYRRPWKLSQKLKTNVQWQGILSVKIKNPKTKERRHGLLPVKSPRLMCRQPTVEVGLTK